MPRMVEVEYTVVFNERDLPAVLDMLRYEGARVTSWSRQEGGRRGEAFAVTLRVERNRFTPDRWASFGLFPQNERNV